MKKLIASMILIAFLFVTPFNAFAETSSQQIANNSSDSITQRNIDSSSTESDSSEEDISEPLLDNNVIISESVQEIATYATTAGVSSGAVYRIKNVGSGKYLNVHYGIDANGTNVYQWSYDGSTEQKFRIMYSSSSNSYKIYPMCSSNGNGRVLDITRGSGPVLDGANVKIWDDVDPISQEWNIISLGEDQFRIRSNANNDVYLASYGNSNGSSGGTGATSAGNVYVSNYVGEMYQHWMFELVDGGGTTAATPTGWLDSVSSTSVSGWAWRSDIPNTPIDVHVYIRNASGQNVSIFALTANQYRGDLVSAGYGNGYHGFSGTINWSNFVPGIYNVTVYAIGYNGNNPALQGCPTTYDTRKDATLIGMRDTNDISSGRTFSTWINSAVTTSATNLGGTVNVFGGCNNISVRERISQSAYYAIATHGWETGITCYTDSTGYTEFTTAMVNALPNGYYNNTRCILLSACSTGKGGAGNSNNLVNTLHAKGAWTVVGFQDEIFHNISGNTILGEWGCQLFARVFTQSLGNGNTVQQAINNANNAVMAKDGWMCGLDTIYVAGDLNQVVKH